jgi:hypothetical protein
MSRRAEKSLSTHILARIRWHWAWEIGLGTGVLSRTLVSSVGGRAREVSQLPHMSDDNSSFLLWSHSLLLGLPVMKRSAEPLF